VDENSRRKIKRGSPQLAIKTKIIKAIIDVSIDNN